MWGRWIDWSWGCSWTSRPGFWESVNLFSIVMLHQLIQLCQLLLVSELIQFIEIVSFQFGQFQSIGSIGICVIHFDSLWFTASCIEIHLYSNVLDKSKAYLRWVYWDSYSYIRTRWINSAYSYLRWLCWDSFSYPLDEPTVHAYSYLRWIYWDSTSYLLDKSKVHSPIAIHFHIY